jgi:membrane-associated phospholipid phosphatase
MTFTTQLSVLSVRLSIILHLLAQILTDYRLHLTIETLSFLLMNLEFMKSAYGELRPDFLARCEYDVTTHECTGAPDVVNEGRKAFPSGHAAVAFAAFVYVVLWIIGKTKPFRYGRVHVLLLANFFIGIALYIGATRVVDNKHHYHDIAWGAFFGSLARSFSS